MNWKSIAKEIGFLEPKSCKLEDLESSLCYLDKRGSFLDPFIQKNFNSFRFPLDTFPTFNYAISLALPYYSHLSIEEENNLPGFSIYCQGKDYHSIFKSMLQDYVSRLKSHYPSYNFIAFSDTGPILDRAVAITSGIGYLGYNSCIIHPERGSYVFLASILTDLPLEEGEYLGYCKKCGACLKACPTGAIKEPTLVDSKICISYLTQKRGFLTKKECSMIKGHIFGCDICQQVCPHNKGITSSSITTPFYILKKPDIYKLIIMDKEYARLIKESASGWRGLNIIKRNALISLAYSDIPLNLAIIKNVAKDDPSHVVRAFAALCFEMRTGDCSLWKLALQNAPKDAIAFRDSVEQEMKKRN